LSGMAAQTAVDLARSPQLPFTVDRFGKITISLGGVCPLRCKHCYTTASQFRFARPISSATVMELLKSVREPFKVICVSGDTDCFLNPEAGYELISKCADAYPSTDIMFTSRLVPPPHIRDSIIRLGRLMAGASRLLVPCISLVSMSYPNEIENPDLVPHPIVRLELLTSFAAGGLPCFLTLRPTFPFSLVGPTEVDELIRAAGNAPAAVLGEAYILGASRDASVGSLSFPGGIAVAPPTPLTFLPQPGLWQKIVFEEEAQFARSKSQQRGIRYFMRSMVAIRFLRQYWDFRSGRLTYHQGDPVDESDDQELP
jgi:DNA repair photolyase